MNWPSYKDAIQFPFRHLMNQRCRGPSHDGQINLRIFPRILCYKCGQPQSGGGLQHSDTQVAFWSSVFFNRGDGLLEQRKYLVSVGKKTQASFTRHHATAVPDEQWNAKLFFQEANAGGYI